MILGLKQGCDLGHVMDYIDISWGRGRWWLFFFVLLAIRYLFCIAQYWRFIRYVNNQDTWSSVTRYRLANAEISLMEPFFTAPTNSGWPYQGCWPGGPTPLIRSRSASATVGLCLEFNYPCSVVSSGTVLKRTNWASLRFLVKAPFLNQPQECHAFRSVDENQSQRSAQSGIISLCLILPKV